MLSENFHPTRTNEVDACSVNMTEELSKLQEVALGNVGKLVGQN